MAQFFSSAFPQRCRVEKTRHCVGRKLARRESKEEAKMKDIRGSRNGNVSVRSHGRMEKRASFINASSQSQHGGSLRLTTGRLPAKRGYNPKAERGNPGG